MIEQTNVSYTLVGPVPAAEATPPREKYTVLVRGRECSDSTAVAIVGDTPKEAFERALQADVSHMIEPIMYWHSNEDIAAIDVDYHTPGKPNAKSLIDTAERLAPRVAFCWVTHGGGLRLIYCRDRTNGFTAIEQAVLAMLTVVPRFSDATGIEIKKDTRHPKGSRADGTRAGAVQPGFGQDATVCVGRLLGTGQTVTEDQVEEWLEEHGYQKGRRVSHAECPIDPTPNDPKSDCVSMLDSGIHCFRCAGTGLAYPGCSTPGFVPWSRLVDSDARTARFNHLRAAVNTRCNWEHAKHIIKYHTGLEGKYAEGLYRLLLTRRHLKREDKTEVREAHEKLIDRCFFPKIPMVRAEGYWAHPSDLTTPYTDKGVGKMIAALPAVCYVDPQSGEIKSDKLKSGLFESNGDLSEYGYPPLAPVRGADIARLVPLSELNEQKGSGVPALVPADPPFRYQSRAARDRATFDFKAHIGTRFPGVNLNLLKLLVAAKGFAQRSASEPPRLLITGQSGGGKTAHVLLAAAVTGDTVGKLPIDVDPEKFIRNYATEAKRNGFVFSDEVAKSRLSPTDLCARLLHVSRETTFHQLYVGSTRVGRLAVHVMADTLVPRAMREEVQLARRIVHVDLGAGVNQGTRDWRMEGDIDDWMRTHHEAARNRTAAHMLVSEVMDEIRLDTTFEEYAKRLGFNLLRDAADGVDEDEAFRELFRQAMVVPDAVKGKWKGEGWKVFGLDDQKSALASAFRACVDEATEGDYQAISGRQWGRALDVPGLVCDVSPHRRQVGIRFRVGDPRSSGVRYNRDVLPEGHPLAEQADPAVLPFPESGPPAVSA